MVELLVVMAIIGMVVAISAPSLARFTTRLRLNAATRQVTSLLSLARSVAISSHEEHAVILDAARRELRVVGVTSGTALDPVVRLPASVTVQMMMGGQPASETQFVFRPTGSLTGRSVSLVLADRERQSTVTVSGTTGTVSVQ
ncbi:MAG: GspH/FimT family pseudopilin [Candidatus Omnitrophica bacterium]|nr:GspH/FimT family pseudopilin [Candidatus Omnitrophota bacterium]MBI3020602.1 GspH/FimT family pseudopilin [Candidatus Omnitrophota bacterium]